MISFKRKIGRRSAKGHNWNMINVPSFVAALWNSDEITMLALDIDPVSGIVVVSPLRSAKNASN